MRKIQIVSALKKEEMRKILQEYLIELSTFDPDIKFDSLGKPIYKWYDCYYEDKDRFPLYFLVDNNIAGIALIRELNHMQYDFAEFYVRPEFRKDGNSIWFATEIVNLFQGEFVFSTRHTNPRAIKFWGKFAEKFENNSYYDDEIWRNFIIRKNKFDYHNLGLREECFNKVKNKIKIFESRLHDEKRQKYKVGDILTFLLEPDRVEKINAKITKIYLFKNFEEMANSLDKTSLGFENKTKDEMLDIYNSIYSKEDIEKYGVAIFEIELI